MTDIGDMIERGSDGPEWEQCRSYETESLRQECWRWIERATKAETENAALRAEVERLREECDFWRSHLHIDSPKMDGQHTWRLMWNHFTLVGSDAGEVVRNALEAIRSQPLPAPPVEEE